MSFIIDQLSERARNALKYQGTTLSAGALALSLVHLYYTGPVLTIRKSNDLSQTSLQDFYADICGNLGTEYLATGTSLNTWLNGQYAYVTKWWDQTGNQNHATQTTPSLQPVYNTIQKYIDFGNTTIDSNGNMITDGSGNAFFNLPNGAFPYGNSEYSFVFKHGVKRNINTYETIYSGGKNLALQLNAFAHYRSTNNYGNGWNNSDIKSINNSYKDYANITDEYDGTNRFIYVNGISQGTFSGGIRAQPDVSNNIGGVAINERFNSQLYYFYFMPISISDPDREILETTYVSPIVNDTPGLYLQTYLPLFIDTSDNGLGQKTVTTAGSVTFDVVENKKCVYFNNSISNYLYFDYTNYSQFTFCFWVYLNDSTRYTVCSISNITTLNPSLQCDFNNNIGYFLALPSQWSTSSYILSSGYINKWIHVAYTVNQTNYTGSMYVNGTFATSVAGTAALGQNKSQFILGKSGDNLRAFNGYIQQFQLYNRLLTDSQIQTIYNETMFLGDISDNVIYNGYPIDQLTSTTKTALINNGSTLSAGALGLSLLYSVYTGPILTIRRSSDSVIANFYADICGNLGTGYLATGTSLNTWLNSAYAYVTKWWDQTGNNNHATQTTSSSQPIYNITQKYIDFGTTTAGGNANAYFTLPNGAFPYGNSAYSYIFKHGINTNTLAGTVYFGGNAATSRSCLFRYDGNAYRNAWWDNDMNTPSYSYKPYSIITDKYDGTKRYISINKGNQPLKYAVGSGGVRNQTNTNNAIGISTGAGYNFNSQLYYFYFMPISISNTDRLILESTYVSPLYSYIPDYVPSINLQSYLPLFIDTSDNGSNPQTVNTVGSVSFDVIKNKKCVYFNGSLSNYLYFNFNNNATSQFTISFWFFLTNTSNNSACGISTVGSWVSTLLCDIQRGYDIALHLAFPGRWNYNVYTITDGYVGKWTHITLVVNRQNYTGKTYVNGSYGNTVTGTSAAAYTTPHIIIGKSGDNNSTFNGYIQQFQVYNTLLTDSQIQTVYNETMKLGDVNINYNNYAFDLLHPTTQAKFLNDANAFSACGFGLKLLHSGYTGPAITIRRSSDSFIADFYADICGNLGTRYLAKGTSLNTWLNGAYAYVTLWWDQTKNFNHAIQNTPSLQPIYNTTEKYIDFGISTTGGNVNAYLTLRNSAFPYGNSAYSYIFKHGVNNNNVVGTVYYGGDFATSKCCLFRYDGNAYRNAWGSNDMNTPSYSYKIYSTITDKYDGTNRYISVNGVNQTLTYAVGSGGVRNQPNTNNAIGISTGVGFNFNSQLYYFYVMPISIPDNDRFILETVGQTEYVTFIENNFEYTNYPNATSNQVYIINYFDDPNVTTLNIPTTVQNNGITYNVVNLLSTLGSYNIVIKSSYITTVNIPASITNISPSFFLSFSSLTNFVVDPNNSNYKSNNGIIYNLLETIVYIFPTGISEITVNTFPSTVTSLSNYNFNNYIYLTTVSLPSTITTIGNYVFSGCTSLVSVNLNSVTTIGNYVFNGCTSLVSVNLNIVANIGTNVFNGCTSLPNINIPNTLTTLGEYTFNGCTSLVSVDLNIVATIGNYLFNGCTALPSIIIPNTLSVLPTGTFTNCTSLNSISFQSSSIVNSLGDSLFGGCTSLKTLTMPDSIISGISITNFLKNSSLVSVIYSNGLTTITKDQGGCISLLNVTIKAGTTILQADSFNQCTNLKNFTFLGTVIPTITSTGSGLGFGGVANKVAYLQPDCYNYLTITPYFYVVNIDSSNNITFTQNNIKYTTYAGSANTQLYVSGCTNDSLVTTLDIPNTLQYNSINYSVYFIGISYENIVLTSNYVTTINIPYDISYIKVTSFRACSALTVFTVDVNNPYFSSYGGFILNKSQTSIILPPNGLMNINTNSFPSTLTTLNNADLSGCIYLTNVTLPNTITTFGNYVFYGCTSLFSVIIPNSVTNLGTFTFMNCTSLTNIYFQPTCKITNFGTSLFANCTSLTNFTMPNSVTDISNCFNSSKIVNLIYSNGMTTIPISTINGGSSSVLNITIQAGTTSMYSNSFQLFSNFTSMTFLGKVTPTITNVGGSFGGAATKIAYLRSDCSYNPSITPNINTYFTTPNIVFGKMYKNSWGNNILYYSPYTDNTIVTLKYSNTNNLNTRSVYNNGTLKLYDNPDSRNQVNTNNFIGNDNSGNSLIGNLSYMYVMPISINSFEQTLFESTFISKIGPIDSLSTTTKNAMLYNGTTLSAGAFGIKLLYSGYTGPVLTLRRSIDNDVTDFYADTNGNIGTGYLGTGMSLTNWINGSTYLFVVVWWDQTGNQNNAIQTDTGLQPVYNSSLKYIDFFYGRKFGLQNGAFPYGDSAYSYIFKHGVKTNGQGVVYSGGGGINSLCLFRFSGNAYKNAWLNNDVNTPANSYQDYSTITDKYDGNGTNRYIYVNGSSKALYFDIGSGGVRTQGNDRNFIGNVPAGGGYDLGSQLYYFYFMPISISDRDRVILEATVT